MLKIYRKSVLLIAILVMQFFLSQSPISGEETLPVNQDKLDKLNQELDSIKVRLDFLNIKVVDSRQHVKELEKKINRQRQRISSLIVQLESVGKESDVITIQIENLRQEIQRAQKYMDQILTRFRAKLVHLHKIRQGTLVTSIFSARDLNSFLNRYQLVKYLLGNDRNQLIELGTTADKLRENTKQFEEKQAHLDELASITRKKKDDLSIEVNSLSAMIKTLILERKVFLSKLEKLKKSQTDLEREITKIESARSKDPAFDQHLFQNAATPSASHSNPIISNKHPDDAQEIKNKKARFAWPLKHIEDIGVPQTNASMAPALELLVSQDAEVFAAGKGKVLFKGPMGQLGNIIILAHKTGFSTIYGRLDDVWVGLGQVVETGEVIGRILAAKGARLHFEIRFGGKNHDPLTFLPRLK